MIFEIKFKIILFHSICCTKSGTKSVQGTKVQSRRGRYNSTTMEINLSPFGWSCTDQAADSSQSFKWSWIDSKRTSSSTGCQLELTGYGTWSNSSAKGLVSCHQYFQRTVNRHQHLWLSWRCSRNQWWSVAVTRHSINFPNGPDSHARYFGEPTTNPLLIKSQWQLLPLAQFLLQ